jgi:FixJ family two-component response regulator
MPPARQIIAIVEDDAAVRVALERLLRAAGYRYASFANAESFLAAATRLGAAAVVSDIHLGGMSGLQLALHPVVTGLRLSTLLVTGSDQPHLEESAREIGAALLRKPFLPHQLLEAIVDIAGPPIAEDN